MRSEELNVDHQEHKCLCILKSLTKHKSPTPQMQRMDICYTDSSNSQLEKCRTYVVYLQVLNLDAN